MLNRRKIWCRSSRPTKQLEKRRLKNSAVIKPGSDPGSWDYSPEWMGTQGGNWGHNAGDIAFQQESSAGCSNGLVCVTRHPASREDPVPIHDSTPHPRAPYEPGGQDPQMSAADSSGQGVQQWQEWRVLRFNEETVQSVARTEVTERGPGGELSVVQRPDCMAFLYMKTLAAAVASMVGMAPPRSSLAAALNPTPGLRCRALCIGLGGGSLPLFLSHHFPGMDVEVVEIDPTVITAARAAMGFPECREGLRVHNADAIEWLNAYSSSGEPAFDLIFVDAFDGENEVPRPFQNADHPVMRDMASCLHPSHGVVMVNLHRGEVPSLWQQLALKLQGRVWMDPFTTPVADVYRRTISPQGRVYMLGVGPQYNTIVVAARGQHMLINGLEAQLQAAALATATAAKYRFEVAKRATLDFRELP